jgi:iron complex outermembrane receptor protein
VRVNASAYYNDYKDLQTQNFINGRQFFDNAGKAKIKGFEVETDVVPVNGLTLSGSAAYTDFQYKQFILNGVDVAAIARPTYFSKWTARLAGSITRRDRKRRACHRADRGAVSQRLFPDLDAAGEHPHRTECAGGSQPAAWLLAGQRPPWRGRYARCRAKVGLSVFGDNILDKRYMSFGAPVLLFTGAFDRGRTYGVELGVSF